MKPFLISLGYCQFNSHQIALREPLKTVLFRDCGVSLVLKSSCIRLYTAVLRARLPCTHKTFLVFRGPLKLTKPFQLANGSRFLVVLYLKGLGITGVICRRKFHAVPKSSGRMMEYCGSNRNLTGIFPQRTVLVIPSPIGRVSLFPLSASQSTTTVGPMPIDIAPGICLLMIY